MYDEEAYYFGLARVILSSQNLAERYGDLIRESPDAKPVIDFVCSDLVNIVQRCRPSSKLIVGGAECCKTAETKKFESLLSTTGR
jgi:hypothetical protein